MKKLLFFLILFVTNFSEGTTLEEEYIKYANLNLKLFAKEIKKIDPNFRVIGQGGGLMFDVERLRLHFDYKKAVGITEARKLFVTSLDKFLLQVNSDPKIRIYLHEYPFTFKSINWNLSFNQIPSEHVPENFVTHAFIAKGKIYYHNKRITVYEETYEQARNLVYRDLLIPG